MRGLTGAFSPVNRPSPTFFSLIFWSLLDFYLLLSSRLYSPSDFNFFWTSHILNFFGPRYPLRGLAHLRTLLRLLGHLLSDSNFLRQATLLLDLVLFGELGNSDFILNYSKKKKIGRVGIRPRNFSLGVESSTIWAIKHLLPVMVFWSTYTCQSQAEIKKIPHSQCPTKKIEHYGCGICRVFRWT